MGIYKINPEIHKAKTLPATFYRDQSLFDKSIESVFANSWQFAGDSSFSDDFSIKPFQLLDGFLPEPLLLSKSGEDINCLSNVCTHRGNLLISKPGKMKHLVCGYHGRKFDLEGKFEYMPQFEGVEDFPAECDNLAKVPIKDWRQFLFVSLDPKIEIESTLKAFDERVGFLPIEKFKFDQSRSMDYEINTHWALYCDNFLEGFHIPFVHHDLNEAISYPDYETVLFDYCNLQIGTSKNETECFDLPVGHIDYGKKVAAYYFWVYPNMMFNFYPWGLSINIVKPINMNKTNVSFISYVWDESKIENSAGALLDSVEMEDEEVVEGVHLGLKSRFYQAGRFSPSMEKGVHHFHRLLSEFMG